MTHLDHTDGIPIKTDNCSRPDIDLFDCCWRPRFAAPSSITLDGLLLRRPMLWMSPCEEATADNSTNNIDAAQGNPRHLARHQVEIRDWARSSLRLFVGGPLSSTSGACARGGRIKAHAQEIHRVAFSMQSSSMRHRIRGAADHGAASAAPQRSLSVVIS